MWTSLVQRGCLLLSFCVLAIILVNIYIADTDVFDLKKSVKQMFNISENVFN